MSSVWGDGGSFIYQAFVCDECHTTNFEQDILYDNQGNYEIVCDHCGGTHLFGNTDEDREDQARDAYNDMVRGK